MNTEYLNVFIPSCWRNSEISCSKNVLKNIEIILLLNTFFFFLRIYFANTIIIRVTVSTDNEIIVARLSDIIIIPQYLYYTRSNRVQLARNCAKRGIVIINNIHQPLDVNTTFNLTCTCCAIKSEARTGFRSFAVVAKMGLNSYKICDYYELRFTT